MGGAGHFIVPFQTYLKVLIALLILTVVTVAAARFDFGHLNTVIALLIASVKAVLVAGYFMQLKYEDRLFTVIVVSGVFFLILLFAISYMDFITRIVVERPIQ